jgi:uncharacterized protein (DUF58 family)
LHLEFLHYLSIPFSKPLYDGLVWAYQTKIKGQGSDYESSRPYDTSDHPKYIDRKTTAKKDNLYTKQYHEEQQLHVCLVLDVGTSMQFGFEEKTKHDTMKNIAILLWSIIAFHNDSCSLITYDQDITQIQLHLTYNSIIPNLLQILGTENSQPTTNNLYSNLTFCILHLASLISNPTHYIILTDDEQPASLPLLQVISKTNEISYIHVTHSLENKGIFTDAIIFSDGKVQSNTTIKTYTQQRQQQLNDWKKSLQGLGIHYLLLDETSDLQKSLLSLRR